MRFSIAAFAGAFFTIALFSACGDDDNAPVKPDAGVDTGSEASTGTREPLGGRCTSDDGCVEGLVCYKDKGENSRQWPAHGYCTAKCTEHSQCEALEKGSSCQPFGSSRSGAPAPKWCMKACELGPNMAPPKINAGGNPKKCLGREDVGCLEVPEGRVVCRPVCNDDSACDGAKCEASNGGCTNDAVGSWEDIGNGPTGRCSFLGVTGGENPVCTARCVSGVVPSCGWAGPGTKASAACLRRYNGGGWGDVAQCIRLCETSCDCENGNVCQRFDDVYRAATQRLGVCSPASVATNVIPCGNAGADAGDGGDGG